LTEAIAAKPPAAPAAFHKDALREIRAMAIAALPCPPMPIMACRESDGECSCVEQELQSCSSHDLLAHLMNLASTTATEKRNAQRSALQTEVQAALFKAVDAWQKLNDPHCLHRRLPPVDWTYETMGKFTRNYIRTYMPDPSKEQDVRFLPYLQVDRTHPVHRKALEFQKAQDVLYGKCRMPHRDLERMSYAELLQHSVQRIMEASGQQEV
jgi:hypothetical protein